MLGGSVEVLTKNNLHRFIEGQTHLGIAKLGPAKNPNRLLFIQIQTLPPSMHHKWKESIDSACKTTNGKSYGTNS